MASSTPEPAPYSRELGLARLIAHLDRQGSSVERVLAVARAQLRLAEQDLLFCAGSVVEGLATPSSDVDFFLITDREDLEFTSLHDITLAVDGLVIDVRVVARAELDALLDRFARWRECPRQPRSAFSFTPDERALLHRLAIGVPVHGIPQFVPLAERAPASALARHKLDWAEHLARTVQLDWVGLRDERDPASMVMAAQSLLGHCVDGLLAGEGSSNPNPKWRMRLLARLGPGWEQRIMGPTPSESPAAHVLTLHRAPAPLDLRAAVNHGLRIASFARRVFVVAASRLSGFPLTWPCAQTQPNGSRLPCIDMDVFITRADDGTISVRKTWGQPSLTTIDGLHYLGLCYFDGDQSEAQASAALGGPQHLQVLTMLVKRLQLSAAPVTDEGLLASLLERYRD